MELAAKVKPGLKEIRNPKAETRKKPQSEIRNDPFSGLDTFRARMGFGDYLLKPVEIHPQLLHQDSSRGPDRGVNGSGAVLLPVRASDFGFRAKPRARSPHLKPGPQSYG